MLNVTPINNKQQSFGTLDKAGKFFYEEEAAVLKPIEDFAKKKFRDFGEIHVQLVKPQKQDGYFQDMEKYYHNYELNISPMGKKNGSPDITYNLFTDDLDNLGKRLSEFLDDIFSQMDMGFIVWSKINPANSSEKTAEKVIENMKDPVSSKVFFA